MLAKTNTFRQWLWHYIDRDAAIPVILNKAHDKRFRGWAAYQLAKRHPSDATVHYFVGLISIYKMDIDEVLDQGTMNTGKMKYSEYIQQLDYSEDEEKYILNSNYIMEFRRHCAYRLCMFHRHDQNMVYMRLMLQSEGIELQHILDQEVPY